MIRAFTEIIGDIGALMWTALKTDKGIELLDELATVLGLPDAFPNVDGLEADDAANPSPVEMPQWLRETMAQQAVTNAANDPELSGNKARAARNRRGYGKQTEAK